MRMRKYKGHWITDCEMADWREHGGRWIVITHHKQTGLPWADQFCPHFRTLREAKDSIDTEQTYRAYILSDD